MACKSFVLLEAETGKVFVRPFADLRGVSQTIQTVAPDFRQGILLPEPFTLVVDSYGLNDGRHINFMASWFDGFLNHKVLFGDCAIVADRNYKGFPDTRLDGLDELELRFLAMTLQQCFGVSYPSYAFPA